MAPIDGDYSADAIGCRQDWRAARRSRALARRDDVQDSGPRSASPMTGVGAAICGQIGAPVSHSSAQPPQQLYAAALAEQMEEKRTRKAQERLNHHSAERADLDRVSREAGQLQQQVGNEISQQRQREANIVAREDSLTRFLAEQSGGGSASSKQSPRKVPAGAPYAPSQRQAGRAHSQPAKSGLTPWAMDDNQPDMPSLPARRGSGAPFALQNDPVSEPRSSSRPRGRSPFAVENSQFSGCDADKGFASAAPPRPGMPPRLPQASEFAQPAQRVSSNIFANGSNQNCGNVISDRPTSRVLAPPGGASSFSFS